MRQEFFSRSSISEKEPDPAEAVKHKSIRTEVEDTPNGGKKLKVKFFVDDFEPAELKEATGSSNVVVHREFKREFNLPDPVDRNNIQYSIVNGILTIEAALIRPSQPGSLLVSERSPSIQSESDRVLHLKFDVGKFLPEEISVKCVANLLKVQAVHEEDQDGSTVRREYTRNCQLPETADVDRMTSTLDEFGRLTVEVPLLAPKQKEKVIKRPGKR